MNSSSEDLSGMTANERLFATNQLRNFDSAVERRDLAQIRKILESVHVDEVAIESILKNVRVHGTPHDPTWDPDQP